MRNATATRTFLLAVALLAAPLHAESYTLTLDPGSTKITFLLDAFLHKVHGTASLVRGEVRQLPPGRFRVSRSGDAVSVRFGGRWKLIFREGPEGFVDERLFNLQEDPGELHDLTETESGRLEAQRRLARYAEVRQHQAHKRDESDSGRTSRADGTGDKKNEKSNPPSLGQCESQRRNSGRENYG